jgi:hypothetical protein
VPDGEQPRRTTARASLLRTVLRRVVLGAFCCVVAVIALLVGMVLLSVAGLSFDPHGYMRIFGIVLALPLGVVAMILWALYGWLRSLDGSTSASP